MIHEILTEAGFVLNETYKEAFFIKPPKTTYAVYTEAIERRGGDLMNSGKYHDVTIEVYEYAPDPDKEQAIEQAFDERGIKYTKQARYRIVEENLYQIIYEFDYFEK